MNNLVPPDRALLWLGALFYLGGFAGGCLALFRRGETDNSRVTLNLLLAAGLVFQMAGLYLRGRAVGGCPLANKFEIVQFVAWSAMVLYFVVGPAFRISLLGLFAAGYAGCLATISLVIPAWDAGRGVRIFGNNPWIELHAALAVFSYGVFGLLSLTSLMHLLQAWNLRHKRLDGLFWFLPSVVQLDQINLRLLMAGVGLLTISVAVGAAWWLRDLHSVDLPKIAVTLAVWLVYLVTLVLRLQRRLVSVRFAWVCLVLFVLALVSLGPVNDSRHPAGTPAATR
ncbi:MAG TPA: cytochrome c biogenesis protein CcsA [Candidatus Didemnitutus sp.]|nr:cytochrome c biogenesis protein CcsA [Candidatus Didemnitutus sp.]